MFLQQVMGGGTAHGRVSGAVGVPVLEHPGDCYVWGSCGEGPQEGGPWQHSALPSLMKDTTFLDVQKVSLPTFLGCCGSLLRYTRMRQDGGPELAGEKWGMFALASTAPCHAS